jgi:predicted nucleotidyltransferase
MSEGGVWPTPDNPGIHDFEHYLKGLLGVKVDLVTRRALEGEIGKRILRAVRPV